MVGRHPGTVECLWGRHAPELAGVRLEYPDLAGEGSRAGTWVVGAGERHCQPSTALLPISEASCGPSTVLSAPEEPLPEDSVGPALGGMKDEGS